MYPKPSKHDLQLYLIYNSIIVPKALQTWPPVVPDLQFNYCTQSPPNTTSISTWFTIQLLYPKPSKHDLQLYLIYIQLLYQSPLNTTSSSTWFTIQHCTQSPPNTTSISTWFTIQLLYPKPSKHDLQLVPDLQFNYCTQSPPNTTSISTWFTIQLLYPKPSKHDLQLYLIYNSIIVPKALQTWPPVVPDLQFNYCTQSPPNTTSISTWFTIQLLYPKPSKHDLQLYLIYNSTIVPKALQTRPPVVPDLQFNYCTQSPLNTTSGSTWFTIQLLYPKPSKQLLTSKHDLQLYLIYNSIIESPPNMTSSSTWFTIQLLYPKPSKHDLQ